MRLNKNLGVNAGGFFGLGITYYWSPRYKGSKRYKKLYIHLLFWRLVLSWRGGIWPTLTEKFTTKG